MGTISCYSNQSSYPTGIKSTTYVEANDLVCLPSYSFTNLMISEKKIVLNIFAKMSSFCGPGNQSNSPI